MCMTCGCGQPHESHGNSDNIVYEDLKKAADAENISPEEALKNMQDSIGNA